MLRDGIIDCACLIHDTLYDFSYVDKLYRGLCRNLSPQVKLHVYTESNRYVPEPYIKHSLEEWPGIRGPKSSWWYKIQLFNPAHHQGNLLYFDLDTLIVNDIDWIWQQNTKNFWAAKDFKYLFRAKRSTINSSVMWFDTQKWSHVYNDFDFKSVAKRRSVWHGDQDYIHQAIPDKQIHYLDTSRIRSWKWELLDGGYDFKIRRHRTPKSGTVIDDVTSVLIFHGNPKPHEIDDTVIMDHWR